MPPCSASAKPSWFNLLFILPFLIGYVPPARLSQFNGFWLSLHEIDQLSDSSEFVGLANFARLFTDEMAPRHRLEHLLLHLLDHAGVRLPRSGLGPALNRPGKTGAALRAIFFGSSVLSVTIVTLVWRLVLMPDRGMLANILHALGCRRSRRWPAKRWRCRPSRWSPYGGSSACR